MGSIEVGGNGSVDWRVDHKDSNKKDIEAKDEKAKGRDPVKSGDIQPPDGPKGHFRLDVIFKSVQEAQAALQSATVMGTSIVLFVKANSDPAPKYEAPTQIAVNW
jgi:hypothetical protein